MAMANTPSENASIRAVSLLILRSAKTERYTTVTAIAQTVRSIKHAGDHHGSTILNFAVRIASSEVKSG
jgi:predicted transcriptional regulator